MQDFIRHFNCRLLEMLSVGLAQFSARVEGSQSAPCPICPRLTQSLSMVTMFFCRKNSHALGFE